ncbi:MAG TPA: hypothetical protein VHG33_11315 [Woeseiaceae bacterium]|nr:hypothetical protein [Woeseiaceae bacterium]
MSSAVYEAELAPDDSIRLGLLLFACSASLAGLLLILSWPATAAAKAAVGLVWLLACAAEVHAFRRGMSRICRIRICADGSVVGVDRTGATLALRLLPGTVVLDRFGWLRLRFDDGLRYGELLAGNAAENEQWRRLLVIWRQRRRFGGPPGS